MLAWMDLEMTGLDPATDRIVEIATLLTDDQLNIVAEGPELVIHVDDDVLDGMVQVVKDMHKASGLTAEIQSSTTSLEEAGEATLAFLKEHIDKERTVPLCGNSIGTDRRFLNAYLPDIENFLHYRCVDVSSIKELLKRWNPALLRTAPEKAQGHRAMDDIKESVAELAFYRDTSFILPKKL